MSPSRGGEDFADPVRRDANGCVFGQREESFAPPASQVGLLSLGATFSVTATGTATLHYQWRFNGANLNGATNSALVLTNLQMEQAGAYSVAVFNDAGAVVSSNALLTLGVPVYITMQPQSRGVARDDLPRARMW